VKIGQYLKRLDWKIPHVASDRIRGEWVMKYCPEMEEWRPNQKYDAVIFHNAVNIIASSHGVRILDVCDQLWEKDLTSFKRLALCVHGIVTATDELKKQVSQIVQKPIVTIGDGHYFPFYETRAWNPHAEKARRAVWFGHADNAFSLKPLLNEILTRHALKLTVIAERDPIQSPSIEFAPWKIDTYIREISQADFAVLPLTKPYKSNNKDISALLSGIPVAKTAEDIARLMDPAERQKDMVKAPEIISRHCARDRAKDYLDWIRACSGRK
jgi:hypothetical protein